MTVDDSSLPSIKHTGEWRKKKYVLGRRKGGGYYDCCGGTNSLKGCSETERAAYADDVRAKDAVDAAQAVRLAEAAEKRRIWEHNKTTQRNNQDEEEDERHNDNGGEVTAADAPMLLHLFRTTTTENEWELGQSFKAMETLALESPKTRSALVRNGVVKAVKTRLLYAVVDVEVMKTLGKPVITPLTEDQLDACVQILVAFATCQESRSHLHGDRELTMLLAHRLAPKESFLDDVPRIDNIVTIFAATTEARPAQKVLLRNKKIACDGVIVNKPKLHPVKMLSNAIRAALNEIHNLVDTTCGTCRNHHRQEEEPQHQKIIEDDASGRLFHVIEAAFETFEHLGRYGTSALEALRATKTVSLCLEAIRVIRQFLDVHTSNVAGSSALSSAFASLCQIALLPDGTVDPEALKGIRPAFDAIRSQLHRTELQVQGLHIMAVVAQANKGAAELDTIPGAWQWLGWRKREALDWAAGRDPTFRPTRIRQHVKGWNASKFAKFLGSRPPGQDRSDVLDRTIADLRQLSLLPFETESLPTWKRRVLDFDKRNDVRIWDHIASRR